MWSSRASQSAASRVLGSELQAVRAVHRQRVDVKPLQRLEHGLSERPKNATPS
jgi:hypothetical protein